MESLKIPKPPMGYKSMGNRLDRAVMDTHLKVLMLFPTTELKAEFAQHEGTKECLLKYYGCPIIQSTDLIELKLENPVHIKNILVDLKEKTLVIRFSEEGEFYFNTHTTLSEKILSSYALSHIFPPPKPELKNALVGILISLFGMAESSIKVDPIYMNNHSLCVRVCPQEPYCLDINKIMEYNHAAFTFYVADGYFCVFLHDTTIIPSASETSDSVSKKRKYNQ